MTTTKKIWYYAFALVGAMFMLFSSFEKDDNNKSIPIQSTARFGVNLACGEFGPTPGVYNKDYTYPRVAELDYYKSKGLTLIRMPFKWERVQHDVAGSLDTDFDLRIIKEFVQAAEDRGISVILDMHNYARRKVYDKSFVIGQTDTLTIENFVDVWIKLANEFNGYSNIGYDIMNEPHDLGTVSWFTVSQAVIDGIRSVDDHTPILIEGNSWASSASWPTSSDSLKYLTDPANNIVYEAHCYFDSNASGVYASSYDNEVASDMIYYNRLEPFVEWLKTNNKKGMIGEFGVPGNDPRWLTMLDNALTYMRDNNISATYWAGGPSWGTYKLSIEPSGTVGNYVDKPQMTILSKYGTNDTTAIQHKR
jgi:endoglucanase